MSPRHFVFASVLALSFAGQPAPAAVLILSDFSSDETPASVLDATLTFSLVGDQLSLTVANLTGGDAAYKINEVYFNATSDVLGLTLTDPASGWSLLTSEHANGFGVFDFALIGGVGVSPNQIAAGDSQVFLFTVSFAAPTDVSAFVTDLSTNPPGHIEALAAAKFVQGPGDDSAFGSTDTPPRDNGGQGPVIPLPAAAPMGLVLLSLLAAKRRRIA